MTEIQRIDFNPQIRQDCIKLAPADTVTHLVHGFMMQRAMDPILNSSHIRGATAVVMGRDDLHWAGQLKANGANQAIVLNTKDQLAGTIVTDDITFVKGKYENFNLQAGSTDVLVASLANIPLGGLPDFMGQAAQALKVGGVLHFVDHNQGVFTDPTTEPEDILAMAYRIIAGRTIDFNKNLSAQIAAALENLGGLHSALFQFDSLGRISIVSSAADLGRRGETDGLLYEAGYDWPVVSAAVQRSHDMITRTGTAAGLALQEMHTDGLSDREIHKHNQAHGSDSNGKRIDQMYPLHDNYQQNPYRALTFVRQ